MPQRATNLMFMVGGLLAVVGLALLGANLGLAARSGPKWKRRLVTAGLLVLSCLGLADYAQAGQEKPAANMKTATESKKELSSTSQWKQIVTVWKEAEEIGSGKRGAYPFDKKGRKATLDALAEAGKNVAALQEAGHLTASEAALMTKELQRLTRGVQAKRPTEMRGATCYKPMWMPGAKQSVGRLTERVPLLEKMAESGKLKPEVVSRALATIEADIKTLSDPAKVKQLPEAERGAATKLRDKATETLTKIKALLAERGLETTQEWQTIIAAWGEATPLATSGKSTTAQRNSVAAKLDAARKAASQLADQGMISKAEAGLLASEANRLKARMLRNPPSDVTVMCYIVALVHPAQKSLERLSKRLPLLEKMVRQGKVHRAVMEKVLPSVEADLKTLGSSEELGKLPDKIKAEAEKLRPKAEATIKKIKALLPAAPPGEGLPS